MCGGPERSPTSARPEDTLSSTDKAGPGPPAEGLSVDAIRELLELDLRDIVVDAALMYRMCTDDWQRGCGVGAEAVGLFIHSPPSDRAIRFSRTTVGLVLLICPRVGVPRGRGPAVVQSSGNRPRDP